MVVVAGGVVEGRELVALHRVEGDGVEALLEAADIVAVAGELELVVVGQPVKADVLGDAGAGVVVEGVGQRVLRRYASPYRLAHILVVAVDGYAVLVALETILENVLGDFAEVDVQVAALGVGVVGVEERVEEPELDVFDIGLFEVGVVETAHDAAPALFGVLQASVTADVVGVEVVRAALGGVERQVEGLHNLALAVFGVAAGEDFAHLDLADVRVGELFEVGLEVAGGQRRVALGEHAVDEVPVEQGAVLAVVDVVGQGGLGEEGVRRRVVRRGRQEPRVGRAQVDAGLRRLEVVYVRRALVRAGLLLAWQQACVLGGEAELGGRQRAEGGHLVEQVGEPHELGVPAQVEADHGVVDRFVTDVDFFGQRLLAVAEDGGSDVKILAELVLQVKSQKRLSLHREQ